MTTTALQITDLCRRYREGDRVHEVIRHAGLSLAAGECVALLGRSGAGKSTLLNLIAGIDRPDGGEIRVGGEIITRLPEPQLTLLRRRRIGFVYQFFNLIPTLTAEENVALPLELNGYAPADSAVMTRAMLEEVGLGTLGHAYPDRLSGGEQQRVAIARALVHRPALVLADEPTGNLDLASGEQVLERMFALVRRDGGSLLLVTHSRAVAQRADRILTLEDGVLHDRGPELAW